jgi:RluA family pseudouridine synthase
LGELKSLREELAGACRDWGLKGTILLSPEGVNLFVAGAEESVDRLLSRLRVIPGLEGLAPKRSWSEDQPFNRMLVRLKKEIISFGVGTVRPVEYTSPKIAAKELKKWLDEGRPVTLLDTRNDYEVKLGTFRGAVDPEIKTFRAFPEAVRKLPEDWKDRPIVMFCTGGIRCEKAGPFMEQEGFKEIYQLDGGILKYFEECGGDHFEGDCFVFDQRVGVDPALRETSHAVCYACLAPLDEEDQEDPRYVKGKWCPHCHKSEPELLMDRIRAREERIRAVCDPLPGSVPQEARRPVNIPARLDGMSLLDALCELFPHVDRAEWLRRCEEGRFMNYGGDARGADHVVRAGERVLQVFPPEAEPDVAVDIRVLYEDEAILVVRKPAPLPMHSGGRFHRNTLNHLLNLACAPHVVRMVHRLDANTTGVVVFARTRHVARVLARQFVEGEARKRYVVRVHGHPVEDHFSCEAAISREPEFAGARDVDVADGDEASTAFRVLRRFEDGTALLEARPVTGRTHQIRLHLKHLGFPVVGDPCYGSAMRDGGAATLSVGDPPMMLHAASLEITHPRTGGRVVYDAGAPTWLG